MGYINRAPTQIEQDSHRQPQGNQWDILLDYNSKEENNFEDINKKESVETRKTQETEKTYEDGETLNDKIAEIRMLIDPAEIYLQAEREDPEGLAVAKEEQGRHEAELAKLESDVETLRRQIEELGDELNKSKAVDNLLAESLKKTNDMIGGNLRYKENDLNRKIKYTRSFNLFEKHKLKKELNNIKKQIIEELEKQKQLNQAKEGFLRVGEKKKILEETLRQKSSDLEQKRKEDPLGEFLRSTEKPLSVKDKERLLKGEVLGSLTTDEYLKFWSQRLGPGFHAHISRHGIRDHRFPGVHGDGFGKFRNGVVDILRDGGRLRPPLAARLGLGRGFSDQDVKDLLEKEVFCNNAPTNVKNVDELIAETLKPVFDTESTHQSSWRDYNTVHFARNFVSNEIYGGERDNDIFFVYPSDFFGDYELSLEGAWDPSNPK